MYKRQIAKLAKIYDDKVKETRAARGLDTRKVDDNYEVTRIGDTVSEPKMVVKHDYRNAPTLTLNELLPENFKPARQDPTIGRLNTSFRSERVEFVLMERKLVATCREDLDWELPGSERYEDVINQASAAFLEEDIDNAAALLWSSVGQNTGIGMFAMSTARMDLIEKFRLMVREINDDTMEFETFPKDSLGFVRAIPIRPQRYQALQAHNYSATTETRESAAQRRARSA